MSTRSLNKVMLIGNLTRDPELRYTPQGTAVCSLGLATNRAWTTESGEKREEAEFHRIVAWNKLAELCSQLLTKGRKVFVEGRLQTRTWQGQDGNQRTTTEIVIDDMIILDSRRMGEESPVVGIGNVTPTATGVTAPSADVVPVVPNQTSPVTPSIDDTSKKKKKATEATEETKNTEEVKPNDNTKEDEINPDDIPF
ncbi:MAG: single-stranded DNA-binding protein [Candidatus Gottesmanbacteria bacterium]